jgi:tryptophan synthase alpha chain
MNRIKKCFERCANENRKALIMYVTAGCPDLETTEKLINGIIAAGADIIELGVPFSDPMADGPTIQASSQKALNAGTELKDILAMAGRIRKNSEAPMILFSYYNVILAYGTDKLAAECDALGIDGWLVVDVPLEERNELLPTMRQHNLSLIPLVAPTTPLERAAKVVEDAEGFVYYITVKGVTGVRTSYNEDPAVKLAELRKISPAPVVAGFGISTPELAAKTAQNADGIVVGSALVKITLQDNAPEQIISESVEFVNSLADALKN